MGQGGAGLARHHPAERYPHVSKLAEHMAHSFNNGQYEETPRGSSWHPLPWGLPAVPYRHGQGPPQRRGRKANH